MLGYPCKTCIVGITCSEECCDFDYFLENTANKYYMFIRDELISYRELPSPVRSRIFDIAFIDGNASKAWRKARREELYGEGATA